MYVKSDTHCSSYYKKLYMHIKVFGKWRKAAISMRVRNYTDSQVLLRLNISRDDLGLPWWLSSRESACDEEDAGDSGSILGWERSPGGGHGSPLQYSCLGNPVDRGAWWCTVHGVAEWNMAEAT